MIDDRGRECPRPLPPRHLHLARRKTIRRLWPKLGDPSTKIPPHGILSSVPCAVMPSTISRFTASRRPQVTKSGEGNGDLDTIAPVVDEAKCEGGGSLRGRVVLTPKRRMSRMDAHLTRVTSY